MGLIQDLHLVHQIELNIKLLGTSFHELLNLLVWPNVKNEFHFVVKTDFELSLLPFERLVVTLDIKHDADGLDDEGDLGVVTNDKNNY